MHEEDNFQTTPRARMSPPVDAGADFLKPRQSGWPSTIGVICIVFGALGVVFTILGFLSQYFMGSLIEMAPPEQAEEIKHAIAAAEPWKPWTYALSGATAVLAIVLIVGGVRLTRRRPAAPGLLRLYAVLRMGVVLVVAVITYKIQRSAGTGDTGMSAGAVQAIALAQFIFAIAWGWALPIFLLIWFARRRIKDEVQGWTEAATSP